MASAAVKTETKTVETEVSEKVVRLDLTPEEASVLKTLMGRIRGSAIYTNRKHTDAISAALGVVGVTSDNCCHFESGTITAAG